ncbi:hypothetical protein BDZ91DRAFT_753895 [Kalaharituber pfeilii]|nr:hypothetical protein BDZ91DRAFT_753895 [Kalaharituber pfeilii]
MLLPVTSGRVRRIHHPNAGRRNIPLPTRDWLFQLCRRHQEASPLLSLFRFFFLITLLFGGFVESDKGMGPGQNSKVMLKPRMTAWRSAGEFFGNVLIITF